MSPSLAPHPDSGPAAVPQPGHQAAPAPQPAFILCPYCGHTQTSGARCDRCRGHFEPLSRQATQNEMGPWQVRLESNPFTPGLSFEKLAELIARGKVRRDTIIRGPTTRQFWAFACNTPGIAALLGECHACHHPIKSGEFMCSHCFAPLSAPTDRQHLGLAPPQPLPGQSAPVDVPALRPPPPAPPAPPVSPVSPVSMVQRPEQPAPPLAPISEGAPVAAPAMPLRDRAYRTLLRRVELLRAAILALSIVCVGLAGLSVALAISRRNSASPAPAAVALSGAEAVDPSAVLNTARPPAPEPAPAPVVAPPPVPPHAAELVKTAPPEPSVEVKPLRLDPGLERWSADIDRALELEARQTVDSLSESVTLLERILADARKANPAGIFPLLESRLDAVRQQRDDARLRGLLKD